MDDEIKLAGLEALVQEELEKHLILNSNRLRTYEDARLEIVTYVEAKFGLKIRDSKPSDTALREHLDAFHGCWGWSTLSRQAKEKGHLLCAMGVSSAMEHIFNETSMQVRTLASTRQAKAIKASRGPRVSPQSQAKEKGKENSGKSTGKSKGTKGAVHVSKGSGNGETLKTGISSLENLKSETSSENHDSVQLGQVCYTETLWIHEEWSADEWNDDWSCF